VEVLDPIGARVLVLKNARTSLAIVSLDLILFSSKKVIQEAREKWKLDHVIFSCTHTHSSMVPRGMVPAPQGWRAWEFQDDDPGVLVDWPAFSEDPWYAATEEKVLAAIGEAASHLFPAEIAAGSGPFESPCMAHNRRLVKPDGTVEMMWANPNREPTRPVDPTVGVIQVNDGAGRPRAFLVHYACHPVGLMGSGVLSRDFPGAMCDSIESELGADCMAMFLQGAEGDLDPYDMGLKGPQGFELMRQAGVSLGKGALEMAKSLRPQRGASIKVKESLVPIRHQKNDKVTEAGVLSVVINDRLALVAIAGEPFIQHQLDLREKSPVADTFLLGVAYAGAGSPFLIYLPTEQAVREGGYGATENCFVAGEAGGSLVKRAAADIAELTGKNRIGQENQCV